MTQEEMIAMKLGEMTEDKSIMRVPGGWIFYCTFNLHVAAVFVPEPPQVINEDIRFSKQFNLLDMLESYKAGFEHSDGCGHIGKELRKQYFKERFNIEI